MKVYIWIVTREQLFHLFFFLFSCSSADPNEKFLCIYFFVSFDVRKFTYILIYLFNGCVHTCGSYFFILCFECIDLFSLLFFITTVSFEVLNFTYILIYLFDYYTQQLWTVFFYSVCFESTGLCSFHFFIAAISFSVFRFIHLFNSLYWFHTYGPFFVSLFWMYWFISLPFFRRRTFQCSHIHYLWNSYIRTILFYSLSVSNLSVYLFSSFWPIP